MLVCAREGISDGTRPGTDRHHEDIRLDFVVVQPHQPVSTEPSLRFGGKDRAQPVRSARNPAESEVYSPASAAAGTGQHDPGNPPVSGAPRQGPEVPHSEELA